MEQADVVAAIIETFANVNFPNGSDVDRGPVNAVIGPGWANIVLVKDGEGIICCLYCDGQLQEDPKELKSASNEAELRTGLEQLRNKIVELSKEMLTACHQQRA